MVLVCDMIKRNEMDIANIEYELQAERCDKFLCFTLFLNFKNYPYPCDQKTRNPIEMGFVDQNVAL